jgi:hypothetical protein
VSLRRGRQKTRKEKYRRKKMRGGEEGAEIGGVAVKTLLRKSSKSIVSSNNKRRV